jgi:hypothetical protein
MCVPTAQVDQEILHKLRLSCNISEPSKDGGKNLNIGDIIQCIKNEKNIVETDRPDLIDKKLMLYQKQGQILVPYMKNPMGNTSILSSFKPNETLRDREFSFASNNVNDITPNEVNKS